MSDESAETPSMAQPAPTSTERRRRRPSGPAKVWILNGVVALIAVWLTFWVTDIPPLDAPYRAPWWLLAALVYVTELTVVHLRFRRDAHSFSMSEVPLVIGMFFAAPVLLVAAQIIGNSVALSVNRRQPPIKLAFNLGQFTLQTTIALVVFHWLVSFGDPLGSAGWIAAIAGALMSTIVANLLINLAIYLYGGKLRRNEFLEVFSLSILASVMNTSLGIVAVTVIWNSPQTAWVALVPPLVLFLAYRAYISQRQERSRLESLYRASRVLHESPQIELALEAAAGHARTMLEAEFVEIFLFADGPDSQAYRTALGPSDRRDVMEPVDADLGRAFWDLIGESDSARLISTPETLEELPPGEHPVNEALVAPLTGHGTTVGGILVANRLSDVSRFDAQDVKLLQTLAGQVSVSLENGRLEDSLVQLTELKEELRHQALHDALTGLANRQLFTERVREALLHAERNGSSVAVLFLDLDDFKTVNDSLGHPAGDQLLIEVAGRLRRQCRPEDSVARLGGDEFAVLLENVTTPDTAFQVAERIIDRLAVPATVEGKELSVRASVGICFGGGGDHPDQLLRNADAAMYAAKRRTKGTYQVFESAMHAEFTRRLELRANLSEAVTSGQLELFYQPIADLVSGQISGAEALVRWNHPERGRVLPGQFVPFAEETGLIIDIGRWVLREAIRQAGDWQDAVASRLFTVSINLSPRQLLDASLVDEVEAALQEFGVDPARIVFEITENVLMQTSAQALKDIKELGVGLAIDDFGTGYSSLSYLDRLPIDVVKIDRSFVARLGGGSSESPLVRTVLQLGYALGLETIVEGVETAEQLERVQALGCPSGQGFYLAVPMPVRAFDELLASERLLLPEDRRLRPGLRIVS